MPRAHQISLILVLAAISGCAHDADMPTSLASGTRASATLTVSGPVDVPVTTTISDSDATGALLTRSDDYNGGGFATYSPIGGVHNSLSSHVTSDGSWGIYIGNQTLRTLHLMLSDAGLPFPNGYYYSSVEMASHCFDTAGNSLNIQLLSAGASYGNCSLIVDFDYGSKKTTYKLAMGPAFANTGRALVTCTAAAGGYCTGWTIVPNDTANYPRVAILTAGNGTTSLDGKPYKNSYRVTASR